MQTSKPITQIRADRTAAFAAKDPCAGLCYLATNNAQGTPELRTLVLRDLESEFAIFINASSPKWTQLQQTARPAVLIYLGSIGVQYRLKVNTSDVPQALVAESWQLRPDTPKQLDWYYESVQPQSSVLDAPEALVDAAAAAAFQHSSEGKLTAPAGARGIYLHPVSIERLDLNSDGGPHTRERYQQLPNGDWDYERLVP